METLEAEVAAGWVDYDPVAAASCHATFQADPCGFDFSFGVPSVQDILAKCGDVLTGQQQDGEPCASFADCVTGTDCVDDGTCPGTCTTYAQLSASRVAGGQTPAANHKVTCRAATTYAVNRGSSAMRAIQAPTAGRTTGATSQPAAVPHSQLVPRHRGSDRLARTCPPRLSGGLEVLQAKRAPPEIAGAPADGE